MEINYDRLKESTFLNEFALIYPCSGIYLTGGAIIDILDGKEPKDYDFVGVHENFVEKYIESGFNYKSKTKTAITLEKEGKTIQFLRTDISTFDFKISQAKYDIKKKTLEIDKVSFNQKILIPTNHTFEKVGKTLNALKRVPHYERKGYKLPEATYLSLLNNISFKGGNQS